MSTENIKKPIEDRNNEKNISKKIKLYRIINIILFVILINAIFFDVYRRYDEAMLFIKPELDIGQKKIDTPKEEPDTKIIQDDSKKNEFTLYSVGDTYVTQNGTSSFKVNIQNVKNSNHDIVVRFFISKDELQNHGISINDNDFLIAESGRFEPGYYIDEIVLKKLPDNQVLPKGKYNLTLSEVYYHHNTGVISSYEAKIPVTLEVLN